MSVGITITFKAQDRERLYIPVASEGTYSSLWSATARALNLRWLPLFPSGITADPADLPVIMEEIRQLRGTLVSDPRKAALSRNEAAADRIDFIVAMLGDVKLDEIAEIIIG